MEAGMSEKEKIIAEKKKAIEVLQNELDQINRIEIGRLYKIKDNDWDATAEAAPANSTSCYQQVRRRADMGLLVPRRLPQLHSLLKIRAFESWGYPETFNKESIRFCIVASNNPRYDRGRWRGRRKNINALNYENLVDKLTRATKTDLPLLLGLDYRFPELEPLFKGKSRIKLDG
jgi:hypothetical protein